MVLIPHLHNEIKSTGIYWHCFLGTVRYCRGSNLCTCVTCLYKIIREQSMVDAVHWLGGKGWETLVFSSVSVAVSTSLVEGLPRACTLDLWVLADNSWSHPWTRNDLLLLSQDRCRYRYRWYRQRYRLWFPVILLMICKL